MASKIVNPNDKIRWNANNRRLHADKLAREAKYKLDKAKFMNQSKENIILQKAQRGILQQRQLANQRRLAQFNQASEGVAMSAAQFVGVASGGQTFTPEQRALQELFGQGEQIWGFPESKVVEVNNDLHPSLNGDDGTASMFGWGRNGERSGLF